ncbi:hypothetical protein DYB37_008035 [Aphanomyces astaci]|uniref:Uncharacterized protein n=3 Tax=Aphanomyces astaci TaxID=112090 RepID=A0A418FIL4_APHAT|nr:hypothetical protein DYB37_008035 [Aphanomyces astaci]
MIGKAVSLYYVQQVAIRRAVERYNRTTAMSHKLWDMANRDYRGVTEAEWAVWLGKAIEEEPQDLEVLKKRLTTAIQFDTTILNAASRIGKMLDNLMRALERDDQAAKYDRKKATCGESEHGQVGERAQQEGDQASKQRKQSLGREAKIEGIVSVTTTLLDVLDVTLVTADLMKSLERAGVEVKVISPEPSVIQPNGSSTCPQELLTSRVVMERLDSSEDELLSHAFVKQEVWDVSDVDKWPPQATSAVMTACTVPPPTSKSHMLKTQKASETGGERWLKR